MDYLFVMRIETNMISISRNLTGCSIEISALNCVNIFRCKNYIHANYQLDFNKVSFLDVAFVLWTCFKQVLTMEMLPIEAVLTQFALIVERSCMF